MVLFYHALSKLQAYTQKQIFPFQRSLFTKIKITSDSTCDLSAAQLKEHNISLARLTIIKNGESFLDGDTIHPADIFAHVAAGGDHHLFQYRRV